MPYSSKTLLQDKPYSATGEKRISICLSANGFSFAEIDADGNVLSVGEAEGAHAQAMTAVMTDLKAYFAQVGIKPIGYQSIELIVPTEEHVWVPNELFVSGNNRQYLHAVGGQSQTVLSYDCTAVSCTDVFAANDTLTTAFKVAMPGLVVKSQHAKLAESALRVESRQHPILVIHLRDAAIDIAAFRGGKYLYGNTLAITSPSDALFQVMEVSKLFGMQSDNTELLMAGMVSREDFALFRPYFATARLYGGNAVAKAPMFKGLRTYQHCFVLM